MPLFRSYPQASSLNPTDAIVLDRIGQGTMFVEGINFTVNGPYIFSFSNTGLPLSDGELIGGHTFALPCSVAANMVNSEFFVYPTSLPADTTVIDCFLIHSGTSTPLGTLTINIDGTYEFATDAFDAVAGDFFGMTGPALFDPHFANMFFTGYGIIS